MITITPPARTEKHGHVSKEESSTAPRSSSAWQKAPVALSSK